MTTIVSYQTSSRCPAVLCAIVLLFAFTAFTDIFAQDAVQANKKKLTRSEILRINIENLRDLSLEELTDLAGIVGVSSIEELFDLVITTASKSEEKIIDAPGVVSVLTARELRLFGAQTLKDALNYMTGAAVLVSFSNRNGISIRGDQQGTLYSNHVLIMIDGRPVRESLYGGAYSAVLAAFPLAGVERIELIRGPGSVLYGTGAYSGVVNIIMKKATKSALNLSANGGSLGTALAALDGGISAGDVHISGSAQYLNQNDWKQTLQTETTRNDTTITYRQNGIGANVGLQYSPGAENNLTANLTWMRYNPDIYGGEIRLPLAMIRETYLNADVGYTRQITDAWKTSLNFTATLYENIDARQQQPSQPPLQLGPTRQSSDYVIELTNYIKPWRGLNVIVGGLANVQNGSVTQQRPMNVTFASVPYYERTWWSAYAQADYTPIEQLKLIAGAQVNSFDPGRPSSVVPRLGALWSITNDFTLKLLYGQAFRAPRAAESDVLLEPNTPGLQGNRELKPENVSTFDAELLYKHDNFQASLVYFNSIQRDIITAGLRTMGMNPRFVNADSYRSQGIEFETKYIPLEPLYFTGSLSYQTNIFRERITDGSPVPNWIARLGAGYTNTDAGLSVGIMNIFYSKVDNGVPTQGVRFVNPRTEAYNLLSVNINWDITEAFDWTIAGAHIILTARIENALDAAAWQLEWVRRNINSLPAAPGRGFYGGLTLRF